MNLLKLLGLQKMTAADKPYPYKDILHLWEDDYLMVELLPYDNIGFVKAETKRINDFGQEHFNGTGFTNITPVSEKPVQTIEKGIAISDIETILRKAALEKVSQFHMQGVGILQGDKAPLGFGTNRFAIICERQGNLLKDIWMTGQAHTEAEKQKLINALLAIGQEFNFFAVNWYHGEYYNLVERQSVEEFVKTSI